MPPDTDRTAPLESVPPAGARFDHGHPAEEAPTELEHPTLSPPKSQAAGAPSVYHAMKFVARQSGLARGLSILSNLNQDGGFDCPSCAWPDPPAGDRSAFEFCENGAKAIASETTRKRADRHFFAGHSVAELANHTDHWLEQQGRLVEPMILKPESTHYEPISWDDAFALIASELNALNSPDEALFYTSGRTSNEAAFLYQLFIRQFGTNNLPDCSNMCHESSGKALGASLGIGKGTVDIEDFFHAGLILLIGQNPGTNHPRMLSVLEKAARRGAHLVAINPLKEAGLQAFAHPQTVKGMLGMGSTISEQFLPVTINGDQALFRGIAKVLLDHDRQAPGAVIDHAFLDQYTTGYDDYLTVVEHSSWKEIEARSGISRAEIEVVGALAAATDRIIACWAMGLTQHRNSVATIREVVNVLLLRGAIGKPGAGVCPVRGHSNVQGDRTVGIGEAMSEAFLDALGREFCFDPPRQHGYDTVHAIRAMREGVASVFFAMGGNFLSASPDTAYTAEALRRCRLTVQVSTKLNRSHLVTGRTALILPCLGRSERDVQASGEQFVTVENSMGVVHASHGRFEPASPDLLSEPMLIARLARSTLGDRTTVAWEDLVADYDLIRNSIERVVPGFDQYNRRVREAGGFSLPNPVKNRVFPTSDGLAHFAAGPLSGRELAPGQLLLMTIRSHDQFNTTVYGLDDRYRGIKHGRRVLLMHPDDMAERQLVREQEVDITSHFRDQKRVARRFLTIPYDIPRACVAAYFPEANVLIPVDSVAEVSNTPTSKSVVVTVAPADPAS